MKQWLGLRIALLICFLLYGGFLLRVAFTGLVVSQTCCTPFLDGSGCASENVCTQPDLQRPAVSDGSTTVIGLLVLLVALLLIAGEMAWEQKKRKEEEKKTLPAMSVI
jgi:hypothetical protein